MNALLSVGYLLITCRPTVNASSVNMFKSKIGKYIRRAGYISIQNLDIIKFKVNSSQVVKYMPV